MDIQMNKCSGRTQMNWIDWIDGLRSVVCGLTRQSAKSCTWVATTPCITIGLRQNG